MKRQGILFVISAPSGAGKTSLCKEIIDIIPDLRHSVSYTTRLPRSSEVDGEDYFFVSGDEFRRMADGGEFAEWAEVHGNLYGTALRTIEEYRDKGVDLILDIDCQGASRITESYTEGVFIFVLPPNLEELNRRLDLLNSEAPEVIARRIERASAEIRESIKYDYIIVNNVFSKAAEEFKSIILAERVKARRVLTRVAEIGRAS